MKKIILILLILTFTNYYEVNNFKEINWEENKIIIKSINLKQNFKSYVNSDVNEGIIFLKESDFANDFYILTAHSGTSKIAYFKNLYKLHKNDEIILIVNNKLKKFYVNEIKYVNKTGRIILPVDNKNTLYLTTCDKFDKTKQIVIKCVNKV